MKRPTLLFICLFAISVALHAVTFKEDTKICGVCGQPVHVTIAQNLLTGVRQRKMDEIVQQGEEARKREKITTTLNAPLTFDDTAALFARAAEIEIADNAPSFASFMLYMKAAWVMDDLKNKKKSDEYRKLAIRQMELYMERDAIARTTGDNYLALIDVLRRIGDFEKAKRILSIAELYATESVLPQILAFQKKLIENKDSERYTTADALKATK